MRGLTVVRMIVAIGLVTTLAWVDSLDESRSHSGVAIADDAKPKDNPAPKVEAEAPLSPKGNCPVDVTYDIVDGDPCVMIDVINNGATETQIVFGEWKQAVSFRLYTDKEPFAEKGATWAEFSGNPHKLCSNAFTSAVIICPDEECLKAWEEWFPKACQEAYDLAHPKLDPARIFPDGPHKPK